MTSSTSIKGSRPNILILITDQQRYFRHWPGDFVANHLPSVARLGQKGITFDQASNSTCQCSPSRASFLTSSYPQQNGVNIVGSGALDNELPNFLKMLAEEAGYEVVWKGKWHLLNEGSDQTNALQSYGLAEADPASDPQNTSALGWDPPDAGITLGIDSHLGGGIPDNDDRYAGHPFDAAHQQGVQDNSPLIPQVASGSPTNPPGKSAKDYLDNYTSRNPGKPFCLVVSLVNPHDAHVFDCNGPGSYTQAGFERDDFANLGIQLPANYGDDLSTKPSIQQLTSEYGGVASNLVDTPGDPQATDFVNFYAYLHTVVEQDIECVLDSLDSNGLTDETLIVRFSDHGEMGLSHKLREKRLVCYQETVNIPLIFSHSQWFSGPISSDALVSLVDLYPTLAEIACDDAHPWTPPAAKTYTLPANSTHPGAQVSYRFCGTSLVPILENSTASVHPQGVLFTFDEPEGNNAQNPGWIRCLRTEHWKYAVYFNSGGNWEFEIYMLTQDPSFPDFAPDPNELNNLAYTYRQDPSSFPKPPGGSETQWQILHGQLNDLMSSLGATPITSSQPGQVEFPAQLEQGVDWLSGPVAWQRGPG